MDRRTTKTCQGLVLVLGLPLAGVLYASEEERLQDLYLGDWRYTDTSAVDDGFLESIVEFSAEALGADFSSAREQLTATYQVGQSKPLRAGVGVTRYFAEDASGVRLDRDYLSLILRYSF